jgi:hypothetical protein
MGFFDKAKSFLGGHGVKVRHLIIEQQEPNAVQLPIADTVVKGSFNVSAEKPCTVLSMESRFCMEVKHADGRVEEVVLGQDVFPEPNTSRSDDMVKYPYELAGGRAVEDFFNIIMETDIPTALQERNLTAGQVRFFVKTSVDVKGSPFDPETVNDVRVTG